MLIDSKEKLNKMHNKLRSHKSKSTAKENAHHTESQTHNNRILSKIQNNVNQINVNGVTNGADHAKHIQSNLENGNATHDNRTIAQKLNETCTSIR